MKKSGNSVLTNKGKCLTPVVTVDLAGWPLVLKLEGQYPLGSRTSNYTLFSEIESQVADCSAIVVPVGTILFTAVQFRQKYRRNWQIFAPLVQTLNAPSFFPGIGNSLESAKAEKALRHQIGWVAVSETSIVLASRWFLHRQHFVGGASCAVLAASSCLVHEQCLPNQGRTVLVLPDSGEMHHSTLYNDDYLISHGFSIGTP